MAAVAALAAACGDHAATRVPATTASHGAGESPPATHRIDVVAHPERGFATGAPHGAPIEDLALSPDGTAAITRDTRGGVRLWPDLAGADPAVGEPVVVPAGGARRLSVGGPADARAIAYVDTAGAGHVLALGGDRHWRERFATSPADPLVQLEVLGDGTHTLGLGADRVVRLYDADGRERARLDLPGSRPEELFVADSGRRALLLAFDDEGKGVIDITAQPIAIAIAPAASLAVDGDEVVLDDVAPPFRFAPAADAVAAFAAVDGVRRLVIAELGGGGFLPLAADFDAALATDLAFVGDRAVVALAQSGPSWKVSASGAAAIAGPPVRFAAGASMRLAAARHRLVVASGSWLFVQRPGTGDHAYLGYAPFQPTTGALSADGKTAAWLAGGHIYVEPVAPAGAEATVRIPAIQPSAYRMAFLDAGHLMVLDAQGGLHVLEIASGRAIAQADAGGTPVSFEVDPAGKRILVMPASRVPHLFRYDDRFRLSPPLLAPQVATAAGLVDGAAAMWTFDGAKLRTFTDAELAAGVTQKDASERGDAVAASWASAGDGRGRVFGFDYTTQTIGIAGPAADGAAAIKLPPGVTPYRILPSPDGARIAIHTSTQVLAVYDIRGRELWARSVDRSVHDVSWAPDGSALLTAGMAGAGLWRATDGSPLRVRCGVWFERTQVPPLSPVIDLREAPLCE